MLLSCLLLDCCRKVCPYDVHLQQADQGDGAQQSQKQPGHMGVT